MIDDKSPLIPMTPSQIIRYATQTLIPMQKQSGAQRPLMIMGPPGIGKSAMPYEIARQTGRKLIEERANTWDVCDVRGALDVAEIEGEKVTQWARPGTFPSDKDGPSIFFIDEVPQANPAIQTTLFGLFAPPHKIADYHLPEDCIIITAGNRTIDRSAANEIPAALRDRMTLVEMQPSNEDFTAHALQNDFWLPVIAYLRWKPEHLHVFNAKALKSTTPRGWEIISDNFKAGVDTDLELPVASGIIQKEIATEFVSFLRVWRQLPSPDAVFNDPASADIPTDPSARYALSTALAKRADDDNFERLATYAKRLPGEFGELLIRDAVHACPTIQHSRAYVDWVSKQEGEAA